MHTTTITEWLPSILLLLLPLTNDNYAVVNSVACRRIYAQAVSEKIEENRKNFHDLQTTTMSPFYSSK